MTKFLFRGFALIWIFGLFHEVQAQQWDILGNETGISAFSSSYTTITVLDEVPYVVYRESTGPVARVKRKNPDTGIWQQVGDSIGSNITYTRIYQDKVNRLFVTYLDASNNNRLAVKIYNGSSQVWEPLNGEPGNLYVSSGSVNNSVSQYSSTPRSSLAFDSENTPYIAMGDGVNLTPYVKKFDGSSWVTLGSAPVSTAAKAVGLSLVIDESDIPWLVYCNLSAVNSTTGTLALYRYIDNNWTAVNTTIGGIRHTSMAINSSGNPTIAYFNTGNSNRASVIVYNKTADTWSTVTALSSRDAPGLSLISDNAGNLYCSFIDAITSAFRNAARVFKQPAGSIAWTEMKAPAATGIDEPVGNLTIAAGAEHPYIVYTKSNSAGLSTPVVRKYTPPLPPATLSTKAVTDITPTSVKTGGDITDDGGSPVTERGIVYGTSPDPFITNTKVVDSSAGTGPFTTSLSGLIPATLYYIRAYAVNGGSVTYGNTLKVNTLSLPDAAVSTPKQMEYLTRGVVAVRKSAAEVFISWRLLGTDPSGISFNLYRDSVKLNSAPIVTSTNFIDSTSANGRYVVKPLINGVEQAGSAPVSIWANNQLIIPIQKPSDGITRDSVSYNYSANDCSVGDVDGDGEYEIFVKWDPSKLNHNSGGYSGNQIIDCYKMNGTRLWRIDLGRNINAGPHFTQFMVYDLDGDGKAEMACKTADGTIDGTGTIIGDALADYRNSSGWVHTGPEFLTVFNGLTGAAMATVNYQPARGNISDWGDNYGNRADRFLSAVAYLDGSHPSLIIGRGYYDKLVRAAYDWRDGQLTLRWVFDSKDPSKPGNAAYSSQGNHQMTIGDVDGDGKDEVINGSSAIDDDGTRLWTYGYGHGDALHMTDMDPEKPGMEIWQCLESPGQYSPYGLRLNDARTGETIFGVPTTGDVGRAMAADIDPAHKGYEIWGSAGNLYNVKGEQISTNKPSYNCGIWWDGDLARELLDGNVMDKWRPATNSMGRLFTIYQAAPVSSSNDTKKNIGLTADLLGDWREEMIFRRSDNTALVLFTTNIPTEHRIYTLMHDPQYRTAVAWQNSGYNQPPYPSFYLGYDMETPPAPNIEVKYLQAPQISKLSGSTRSGGCDTSLTYTAEASGYPQPSYTHAFTGATSGSGSGTGSGSVFNKGTTTVTVTAANSSGTINYSFDVTVIDSIKPVITAPANLTVSSDQGHLPASYIILGTPSSSDNCEIDSVWNDAPAAYPIGITTVTWKIKDTQGNIDSAKQTITVSSAVKVQYKNGDASLTNNQGKPQIRILNNGGSPILYSELSARYWIRPENYTGMGLWIDYAQIGNNKVSLNYVALDSPRVKALGYIEYQFSPSAGTLAAGTSSGVIESRFANTDWSVFNEANDHSFAANTTFSDNQNITLYRNGELIWGTEPVRESALMRLKAYTESKSPANSNTISTYLDIRNEGNIAVDYKDLTAKYWLTSEGFSPMNFSVDYAKAGSSAVTGTFGSAGTGVGSFLELKIRPAQTILYPQSASGNIQYRISKSDWSAFNQQNDHSYQTGAMSENTKVTIYYKGQLVYGTEPSAALNTLSSIAGTDLLALSPGEEKLVIYPNPSTGEFNVRLTGDQNGTVNIQVYSVSGALVKSLTDFKNGIFDKKVKLPELPAGSYLVTVSVGDYRATQSLIVAY